MPPEYHAESERVSYIYTLVDPRTEQPRYVGKADEPPRRLARHLVEVAHDEYVHNPHKAHWFRALAREGLKPVIRILECVPLEGWQVREVWWIAHLREVGAKLLNATDGGEGGALALATERSVEARRGKPLPVDGAVFYCGSHLPAWAIRRVAGSSAITPVPPNTGSPAAVDSLSERVGISGVDGADPIA